MIIPCVLFSVGITWVSYSYLIQFFRSTQEDSLQKLTEQVMFSLTNSTDSVNELLVNIKSNGIVNDDISNLDNVISIIFRNRSTYIKGIVFIGKDGKEIGYPITYWHFGEKEKNIIQELLEKNSKDISWSEKFYSNIDTSNDIYQPLCLTVMPIYHNHEYIGALSIVIGLTEFLSSTSIYNGNYEITTYLYEKNGKLADNYKYKDAGYYYLTPIASAPEEMQDMDSAIRYLEKNGMCYSYASMKTNPYWSIIIVADIYKLQSKFQPFNLKIIAVIIVGFLGLLLIYIVFIHEWFTVPMNNLSKGIRHVSGGDFDYRIKVERKDEFGEVAMQFNHMSEMVKELIEQVKTISKQKSESDMNVLLSQIRPHFLYNTLDVINMMVDSSPREKVHEALSKLVKLLRYGLSKNLLQNLDDELDYTCNYIELLKIRYGEILDYSIEKGKDIGNVHILKLLLQPLVENAVFHGLLPLEKRKGHLLIKTWMENSKLSILVSDNGVGISSEKIESILSGDSRDNKTGGIGIANVRDRIFLYYGKESEFTLRSEVGKGTDILIRLPVQMENTALRGGFSFDDREKENSHCR